MAGEVMISGINIGDEVQVRVNAVLDHSGVAQVIKQWCTVTDVREDYVFAEVEGKKSFVFDYEITGHRPAEQLPIN